MKFSIGIIIFLFSTSIFAEQNKCKSEIKNYKLVEHTTYSFTAGKERACFFAFYTTNIDPMIDPQGNGNLGDAVWYGFYKLNNPSKIYEFPKPSDTFWTNVCSIDAISFYPMHGGKQRDVTVIGSCNKQNAINYTFPFVFIWRGNKFILDKQVNGLLGYISLTVADIREYIKSPETYYKVLRKENT